ncbi:mobilization protein [Campylobacter lari]|nr:mobilization protein [Campylobacter lari]EAK5786996.1 mobilization protein [Campylobacter lari]
MNDLENLSKHFQEKYGFQCYQIAIHRDEGHINEQGEKVINHHAHMEFITLDRETGKNNYRRELITPKVLRQMQTEVAEILGMERGEDKRKSGVKRIEPRAYAVLKEKEKKERELISEMNKMDLQEKRKIVAKFNKALKNLTILEAERKRIEAKIKNAEKIIEELETKIK